MFLFPDVPVFPNVPGFPDVLDVPGFPDVPLLPDFPLFPDVPVLSNVPMSLTFSVTNLQQRSVDSSSRSPSSWEVTWSTLTW